MAENCYEIRPITRLVVICPGIRYDTRILATIVPAGYHTLDFPVEYEPLVEFPHNTRPDNINRCIAVFIINCRQQFIPIVDDPLPLSVVFAVFDWERLLFTVESIID